MRLLLAVLACLLSVPGMAQTSDAPSLAGVIDLHAHVAPETAALSYKRSVDAVEAAQIARKYGMRGLVFKEHTTETASWAYLVSQMVPGSGAKVVNAENPTLDYGPQKIADIRALGPENIVLTTDLGQPGRPSHAEAFRIALVVLQKEGFSQGEIDAMTKHNPARFLGLQ